MRTKIILLLTILAFGVAYCGRGGPDGFGYTWIDSDEPGGPTFNWIDIKSTGTNLHYRDDNYTLVRLSHPFNYYNIDYDTVTICSNGWIALGTWRTTTAGGYDIPHTTLPNNTIAAFWTDLFPQMSDTGQVYYQDLGDKFVVSYIDIPEYYPTYPKQTFQIILDYRRREIILQYLQVTRLASPGHRARIGWENRDGTDGIQIGIWTQTGGYLHDLLAVRIRAVPVATPPYFNGFANPYEKDFKAVPDSGWEIGFPPISWSALYLGIPSPLYIWGTKMSDMYSNNAEWYLYTPHLDLFDAVYPIMDFWHYYSMQTGLDGGVFEVSTDEGSTWVVIEPENGYPVVMTGGPLAGQRAFSGHSHGWEYCSFDLRPYIGMEIMGRFKFISNATVTDTGWYIDNFGLHNAFGVVKGKVDLRYSDNDSGAEVRVMGTNCCAITDTAGEFFIDSVVVGSHYLQLRCSSYVAVDSIPFTINRFDTIEMYLQMSPIFYFSDFDEDSGGLIPKPIGGWQWGKPEFMVGPENAYSDSFCWGTNLHGDYDDSVNWQLILPVNIRRSPYPVVTFYTWYRFNGEFLNILWDGGNVKVSADSGRTWKLVYPTCNYDGTVSPHNPFIGGEPAFGGVANGDYWRKVLFPLYCVGGESLILIKFEIGSDAAGTEVGWYIDDILVYEDSVAWTMEPAKPKIALDITASPNPFNSSCLIKFSTTTPNASAYIVDLGGRRVKSFGPFTKPDVYRIRWSPKNLPSGVYFLKLVDGTQILTKKIVFMK